MKPKKLDEKGRCCGRKPIVSKREPYLFCPRCDAQYPRDTQHQMENFKYKFCDNCGEITENSGRSVGNERDCLKCGGVV